MHGPAAFLVNDNGLTKTAFRRAMRGIAPDPFLGPQDKTGFEPPQRNWLAALDPWVREILPPVAFDRRPACGATR